LVGKKRKVPQKILNYFQSTSNPKDRILNLRKGLEVRLGVSSAVFFKILP
jgi:hypothetical protein